MLAKNNLLFGLGVIDGDHRIYSYNNQTGKKISSCICPFYRTWHSMLTRCYSPAYHKRFPTYVGCSVVPEWLIFSTFRTWMETQKWQGMELDKDTIKPNNKEYGPSTCVFISQALNTFLVDNGASRGEWPVGVHWHKRDKKFMALCRDPFTRKQDFLGNFTTPEAAHEAWRKRKHEIATIYAGMQEDPRVAAALMTRFLAPYKEIREV